MTQDVLYHFVKQLNSEFIGPILVFVLLGAGVFFTFRFKFSLATIFVRYATSSKVPKEARRRPSIRG